MTILEAVTENINAMEKAGHFITVSDLVASEIQEFGHLAVLNVQSRKGKRGRVYSIFTTAEGPIGFWPLAATGPRIGRYIKQ